MSTLPDRLLIGLVGRAGAGKTTVGNYLEAAHAFDHIAFADPIACMLSALFDEAGVPSAFITERGLKEVATSLGHSYRRLAQTLGTEWGRRLADDFWLRVAANKLRLARQHGFCTVISDVRFPNEAAWIVQHGGFLVRVLRELQPAEPTPPAHESEAHWRTLPVHAELHNHGSVATLELQVEALLDTFGQPRHAEGQNPGRPQQAPLARGAIHRRANRAPQVMAPERAGLSGAPVQRRVRLHP